MTRYWYEGFLGLRYLRASPKRGFVSLIAAIAIVGLVVGVAVLIVVLSVMNGFEQELRTRILSLTAHATISGLENRIPDWRPQANPPGSCCAVCCRRTRSASSIWRRTCCRGT
jgi:ABC-type lipoprotein release transport system permease subunit